MTAVAVNVNLTKKQAGALYMKSLQQEERIKELESALNSLVTEYCDRQGYEDWPAEADSQSCEYMAQAMRVLDL